MCGIFGFQLNRPLTPDDIAVADRALDMISHRGPDGRGIWHDTPNGVLLGHVRLAVVDLTEASAQPMIGQGAALTYNGEVYNYPELRKELEARGETFTSNGDTEVVLKAWQNWGPDAMARFDGMFAFAITTDRRLHLVTDFFGEKPLFWAATSDGVFFCSEAHVLIKLLDLDFAPTAEETAAFLSLGFIPAPKTGFRQLHSLPAGSHAAFEDGRCLFSRTYWQPPRTFQGRGSVPEPTERNLDEISDLLLTSLRRRLRADVPVGLFLSGGVDSSLLAALTAKELHRDVNAYTVSFPDGIDEAEQAASTAAHFGIRHKRIYTHDKLAWGNMPELMRGLFGTPNDTTTAISVWQMSAVAKQHLTVALSGIGADELFYGYGRHSFFYRRRAFFALAPLLSRPAELIRGLFADGSRWHRMAALAHGNRPWKYVAVKNQPAGSWLAKLPAAAAVADSLCDVGRGRLFEMSRACDIQHALPGSYLSAVDRGSMRASVEVRAPYLFRDLLDYVAGMDQRSFVAFGPKEILWRILDRYIDRSAMETRKQGFTLPSSRYFSTRSNRLPAISGIPSASAQFAWDRREALGYTKIAIRLAFLAQFHGHPVEIASET
jgi:asparagine synthase (glutamine-hydrolysing)